MPSLHLSCLSFPDYKTGTISGDAVGDSKKFTHRKPLAFQGRRLVPFPQWDRGPTIKAGRQAE